MDVQSHSQSHNHLHESYARSADERQRQQALSPVSSESHFFVRHRWRAIAILAYDF